MHTDEAPCELMEKALVRHIALQEACDSARERDGNDENRESVCPACHQQLESDDLGSLCTRCDAMFDFCARTQCDHDGSVLQSLGRGWFERSLDERRCIKARDAKQVERLLLLHWVGEDNCSSMSMAEPYRQILRRGVLEATPLSEVLADLVRSYVFERWSFDSRWPGDSYVDTQDHRGFRCYWRCRFCERITSTHNCS